MRKTYDGKTAKNKIRVLEHGQPEHFTVTAINSGLNLLGGGWGVEMSKYFLTDYRFRVCYNYRLRGLNKSAIILCNV